MGKLDVAVSAFPKDLQVYAGIAAKMGGGKGSVDSEAEVSRLKTMVEAEDPAKAKELMDFLASKSIDVKSILSVSGPVQISTVWDWGKGSPASIVKNKVYITGVSGDANGGTVILAQPIKKGQKLVAVNHNEGGAMWYGPTGYQIEL